MLCTSFSNIVDVAAISFFAGSVVTGILVVYFVRRRHKKQENTNAL